MGPHDNLWSKTKLLLGIAALWFAAPFLFALWLSPLLLLQFL